MLHDEKLTLDDALIHYGVLGMKWGITRRQGSASDIRSARSNVSKQKKAVEKAQKSIHSARTDEERQAAVDTHASLKMAMLNNPDRVIAARLTKGEKAVSYLLLTPVGATALISTTSVVSRRIEYKQDKNRYTKP